MGVNSGLSFGWPSFFGSKKTDQELIPTQDKLDSDHYPMPKESTKEPNLTADPTTEDKTSSTQDKIPSSAVAAPLMGGPRAFYDYNQNLYDYDPVMAKRN